MMINGKTNMELTAKNLINDLKNIDWIKQVVLREYPKDDQYRNEPYKTTKAKFFSEVTVRLPTDELTRRGKPKPQRRRMDLVAVVLPHIKIWQPLLIGVEVKVNKHDLMGDNKITDYLNYCHLFYLAVPVDLVDLAKAKVANLNGVGILADSGGTVNIIAEATRRELTAENQRDLQAELLIKLLR